MLPPPDVKTQKTTKSLTKLTVMELNTFMNFHGFSDQELANLLGVTIQAVRLWKRGQRDINLTISRLLRLFDKHPHLMRDF